jgi:hypothetical protein
MADSPLNAAVDFQNHVSISTILVTSLDNIPAMRTHRVSTAGALGDSLAKPELARKFHDKP